MGRRGIGGRLEEGKENWAKGDDRDDARKSRSLTSRGMTTSLRHDNFLGQARPSWLREAEVVQLIFAFGDDLVGVDPDIAVAGEDVDVSFGFPVGMGLAAVGVAEGDVDAGEFFVLEKNADHFGKTEVGAEGEFADAVAVFVGVAVIPEFLLEIFAIAVDFDQARVLDFERERRGLQIAVFAVEVIAGGGVADECAVYRGWRRENLAGGEIRPVARADETAGFDPVEAAIEMRVDDGACVGANAE